MASTATASSPPEPKNEQEIISTYKQMQSEMQGLIQNLTKIEMERNEHRYVIMMFSENFHSNDKGENPILILIFLQVSN